MTSSSFTSEDIKSLNFSTINDIGEVIKCINRSQGFNVKKSAQTEKLDFISKIANAKGKSINELKIELEEAHKKLKKAFLLWNKFFRNSAEKIETINEVFNLIAECNCASWDFYSLKTRKLLIRFASYAVEFENKGNIEQRERATRVFIEHKKSIQRLANSVFGAVEWKNCETELGRKLFYIRQEIILSGEPLLNETEIEQYLQERE
jgi:hypothetical protein